MTPLSCKTTTKTEAVAMHMARLRAWLPPAGAGALWKAAREASHRQQAQVHTKQMTQPALPPPVFAQGKPHDVAISRSRSPEAARHIDDAQRQGQPSIVHIDRAGAAQRRSKATASSGLPEPLLMLITMGLGIDVYFTELRLLSNATIGRNATDNMVGILAADVVRDSARGAFGVMGWILRRLWRLLTFPFRP